MIIPSIPPKAPLWGPKGATRRCGFVWWDGSPQRPVCSHVQRGPTSSQSPHLSVSLCLCLSLTPSLLPSPPAFSLTSASVYRYGFPCKDPHNDTGPIWIIKDNFPLLRFGGRGIQCFYWGNSLTIFSISFMSVIDFLLPQPVLVIFLIICFLDNVIPFF